MRSRSKAPSAGPTTNARARGALGRLGIAIFAAALAALALGASAQAATPTYLGSFNGADITPAPANPFTPGRIAVNEETGDVYVIDTANDAIRVFDAEGDYESSILGSSITPGAESFGLYGDSDIAVDNSGGTNQGNVYVNGTSAYFGFDADGDFLWEEAGFGSEDPCGVGVDPAGNPWTASYANGIQKREAADGTPLGSAVAVSGQSCEFDFDSDANLFLLEWNFGDVNEYSAASSYADFTVLDPGQNNADVAVDRSDDDVFLVDEIQNKIVAYDSAGAEIPGTPFESGVAGHIYLGVSANPETNTIYVTDTANKDVEIFGPPSYPLNLSLSGTGLGEVKCDGGPCAAEYLEGTVLTLTATPAAHSAFAAWTVSGADPTTCAGTTSPCTITIGAEEAFVDAGFDAITHTVAVTVTGKGSVSANSGPISGCTSQGPPKCSGAYAEASPVLLTATPAAHQKFTGWSGCDSEPVGTGKCQVNVDANESVSATFAPIIRKLTVAKAGAGSGTITCNGGACAPEYEEGTVISIAASPAAGSSFAGFSGGGCSASPCSLTLGADATVTGTFDVKAVTPPPPPPPPAPSCVVPKLKGKSLGQAKSALSAAHCTLGKVTKPKPKKGKKLGPLVVSSSTPGAGAKPASGKVDLKLGPKPKKKKG